MHLYPVAPAQALEAKMINFVWPWLFLLLPLPFFVYRAPAKANKVHVALRMPHIPQGLNQSHMGLVSRNGSLGLLIIIWLLLVTAATRPQWLGESINIPAEGREMIIAVDLSGSMQVEDMQIEGRYVNRLALLKSVLGEFITRRTGDRLGLILFADDAYVQTPMTYDLKTVRQMLNESVLGLVGEKTAIGDAIGLAVKRFSEKAESNKVLILVTDGQNTAGRLSPEQGLELAVSKGVKIYPIGVGADEMIVNTIMGARRVNPSVDLDEKGLTRLAEQTSGRYFRARDSESMEQIYQLLDQFEPVEQDLVQLRPLSALFYWPLTLAFVLSLLMIGLMSRSKDSSGEALQNG